MKEAEKETAAAENNASSSDNLAKQIETAAAGLVYMSETDAKITPYIGWATKTNTTAEILKQAGEPADAAIEEKDFNAFFAHLTEIQDWFGDDEKETAQKFVRLKEVLENNLRELKVYKIGKIELNIYAVGLDENDKLLGIKTKAVET